MKARIVIIAGMGLLATPARAADDEPICAGRPGLASATCTVPAGRLQVETGIADWSRDRSGGTTATELVLAATDLKYGLSDRSHIELALVPYVRSKTRDAGTSDTASGVGDLTVRYLHRLTDDGAAVAVGVYPFFKIPTAKQSIGNGRWEGGVVVPIDFALPDTPFSVTVSPEARWVADEDGSGRHFAIASAAGISADIASRLSLAVEVSQEWDWDPAGTARQTLGGLSAAFLVNPDFQIDGGVNLGLNRAAPDVQLYVGAAARF